MAAWSPQANDIFLAAAEIDSAEERARYLDQACGADAELRAAVESLLRAGERAAGSKFLESQADTLAPTDSSQTRAELNSSDAVGTTIGNYKLLERLGEGGFGVVYMAEQFRPVQRKVAIKIIKPGMDSAQVIARFEAERQALALMDHPNIARVLDAGTTEAGRPYFVMELVKGIPITRYCDQEHLTPHERLRLFIPVCQAVQHAHQKGVIHRDLKPSNVLIALYDGRPVPKVIDFGVAKAIAQKLTDRTMFTAVGSIIGTLEYMAPEQAELNNLDVDTRADIYSLGVILYELLTGGPPFSAEQLRGAAFDQMLRMIREVEPQKPSTRLSTAAELPSIAANRKLEPRRLTRLLHGELDWIVMKALEKERVRRYETANGVAMDLQRYLNDEPVTAGPPSQWYRLRKFARRHHLLLGASGAIALAVTGGLAVASWALVGEARQRRVAQEQRDLAESRYDAAIAVTRFQADMLRSADPAMQLGDKVTVLQAVTAAIKELDAGKLSDQPLVEANVRTAIGDTLTSLGRFDLASPNYERALELRQKEFGPRHRMVASSLREVGENLQHRGKLREAEQKFRESLQIYRDAGPAEESAVPSALAHVAETLKLQGRTAEAEPLAREALALQRKLHPMPNATTEGMLTSLGLVLRAQRKFDESETLLREALNVRRASLPPNHPDLARAIGNLGTVLDDQTRFAESSTLFLEALEIQRKALPPNHPDLGRTLVNIAWGLFQQEKPAEAVPYFQEAIGCFTSTVGKNHWMTAATRRGLGSALTELHRFSEAETELLEAERNLATTDVAYLDRHARCLRALVSLYEAWEKAEPGKGYDSKAREWQAKLPATRPATTKSG